MHDCRLNGGHFFVYKPQNHAFRCRRCSERFINSYTDATRKHPWKCLIEKCEYVTCDPCSSILVEELANAPSHRDDTDRVSLVSLDIKEDEEQDDKDNECDEDEDEKGRAKKTSQYARMEGGGARGVTKAVVPGAKRPETIEAGEDDEPYESPTFICRTARQAAAQAAMKRAHIKKRLARHGEGAIGERAE